ncbi:MAG: M20/M25/M40 family metallo-hydrolase [Planctomycetota bacterium]
MNIDTSRAVAILMDLLRLAGVSGAEAPVADYIIRAARKAGVKPGWIKRDRAHLKSPVKGNAGNLIIRLPGTRPGRAGMFSAHIDKVAIAAGCVPVRRGNTIRPQGATALGGDDRSGTGVLLVTLENLLKHRVDHPPLVFLFTVQEEIGLFGSRYVDRALLGRPAWCYNFDGRLPNQASLQAPSAAAFTAVIHGLAAHAGQHPDRGISAALIFADALMAVKRQGLYGEVRRGGRKAGTSNVGVIGGGSATNVVMDRLTVQGEARAYSAALLKHILAAYRTAFERAARRHRNAAGRTGRVTFTVTETYRTFDVPRTAPAVRRLTAALKGMGLAPEFPTGFGGLDANWFNSYGIPTVTLGAGERDPHTPAETQDIPDYLEACRLALRLAAAPV